MRYSEVCPSFNGNTVRMRGSTGFSPVWLVTGCVGIMLPAFTYSGIWPREKLRCTVTGPWNVAPLSHSIQSPGGSHKETVANCESLATGCVIGLARMLSPNMYSFLAV